MKLNLALLFLSAACFGQIRLYPTTVFDNKELPFKSVVNSKTEISQAEFKNFAIVDTITKPCSLMLRKSATLYIAIRKTSDQFEVYELFTRGDREVKTIKDFSDRTSICTDYVQVSDIKSMRLDKSGSRELTFKFLHQRSCCPSCSVPLYPEFDEGYVIFDFDKLQALEITTRSEQRIYANSEKTADAAIKLKSNYLQAGRKKYVYRNDKLIQK